MNNDSVELLNRKFDEITSETLFKRTADLEKKMSEPFVSYDTISAANKFNCYITVLIDLNIYPEYVERKGELLKKGKG